MKRPHVAIPDSEGEHAIEALDSCPNAPLFKGGEHYLGI